MSHDLTEAYSLEQKNPERADELYRQALHSSIDDQKLDAYQKYGDFLQRNLRLKEATVVYKEAIDATNKSNNTRWEAYFLERQSSVEHDQYTLGELEKPNVELLKRAIAIRPEAEGEPTHFGAMENLTLGQVLSDCGDYKTASTHLERALDQFRKLGEPARVMATNAIISCLVQQGHYSEANKRFLQAVKDTPGDRYPLQFNFLDVCRRKQLRNCGIVPKVRKLLNESKFDELENLAEHYRQSAELLASGRWYVDGFYADIDNLMPSQSEKEWHERIELIKTWEKEKPTSVTAKIALALVLKSYAWKAQGSGMIRPESEQAKLMAERLQQARSFLTQAHKKPPEWYGVAAFVAIGQHWEQSEFDNMVAECQHKYPKYDTVLLNKAYWLQPRWYGKPGDAESFIEKEAKRRSPEEGNILYARAAWWLDRILGGVFHQTKFQYPRTKEGMSALRKRYPGDPTVSSELCILALQAGDMKTAESAFNK